MAAHSARVLAGNRASAAGRVSPLHPPSPNLLDFRGHAQPDRAGLRISVHPRQPLEAGSVVGAGRDPDRLLGGVRAVSAAGIRFRMEVGRRQSERFANASDRIRRALEQEYQRRLGLRHVVLESLFARREAHEQRGRLLHAQFHTDAGHNDSRPDGRASAVERTKRLGPGCAGCWRRAPFSWRPVGCSANWESVP